MSQQMSSPVTKSNSNQWGFSTFFRIVGYGLLLLALLDIIDIFTPLRFTDPIWEFQVVRNLVERVPVPLIGIVLVFAGEKNRKIFNFLSWASLVAGILFVLLIFLGISSSWRLEQQNKIQVSQQLAQIQPLKVEINQATTGQQLQQILTRLNPQLRVPEVNNPQQLKSHLLAEIAKVEANAANARLLLIKNAVKSILGALIAGVLFFTIWSTTREALKV